MLLEIELYEARTRLSQDHALKSESEGDFADVARQASETEMSAAWQQPEQQDCFRDRERTVTRENRVVWHLPGVWRSDQP